MNSTSGGPQEGGNENGISESSPLILQNTTQDPSSHIIRTSSSDIPSTRTYYYSKKSSYWSNIFPFIFGTIFGTALWPLLFMILTYTVVRNTKPHNDIHPNFNRPQQGNHKNQTHNTYGKSRNVKFDDIAGLTEAKLELSEIVDYIRNPKPYEKLGARLPKGVLLVGPPGSGKTMLANAVATEAGVSYLYASGSEFVEIYVGQGAKRVRQLFHAARNISPCILFIDELDAVGGKRVSGNPIGGGHREHDQTLNQLLVELDGFSSSSQIVVLAATNRIDSLDPALIRRGRFDRIVEVGLPDIKGREAIINMYLRSVSFKEPTSVINYLAKLTAGFSGADLENLINEAALIAARTNQQFITEKELHEARDKVSMGPERRSLVIPERQRTLTAYHEAGHALVAYHLLPETDPIHKITIISRGSALGFVEQIPLEDRYNFSLSQLKARLAVIMGGRAAERIIFGKNNITSGASSDIETATNIAYKMVCDWGMSDKIGPLKYAGSSGHPTISAKTFSTIEEEVKGLVSRAQNLAESILRRHRWQLDTVAKALLERETLSGVEFKDLLSPNPSLFPFQFNFFQTDEFFDLDSSSKNFSLTSD